eukprot:1696891-Rhodomonas_salina.1
MLIVTCAVLFTLLLSAYIENIDDPDVRNSQISEDDLNGIAGSAQLPASCAAGGARRVLDGACVDDDEYPSV